MANKENQDYPVSMDPEMTFNNSVPANLDPTTDGEMGFPDMLKLCITLIDVGNHKTARDILQDAYNVLMTEGPYANSPPTCAGVEVQEEEDS